MTNSDRWIPLKDGNYVSAKRINKVYTNRFELSDFESNFPEYETTFTLSDASLIGNSRRDCDLPWKKYDMEIDFDEPPIDKFIKAVIVLGRQYGEEVYVPSNIEYINMMFEIAHAKARGEEPLASFNGFGLRTDLTRDIVEFHGKIESGPNKGKYAATLLRFNYNGILEPIDDVVIAQEGQIMEIDEYGLPTRTNEEWGPIENIDTNGLNESETIGRLYILSRPGVSPPPEKNEQRIVMRVPDVDVSFFSTHISRTRVFDKPNHFGALRIKRTA